MSAADFTVDAYDDLLGVAQATYRFVLPREALSAQDRFVFWRHDVDFSLNRALALATLEARRGLVTTYFVNPHADFYSLLEPGQGELVKAIVSLGHRLGLHFDAALYELHDEDALTASVRREAAWLRDWFDVEIEAFAFHNPMPETARFDRDTYGDLVNCYGRTLRHQIGYCSDSNGHWRHERIFDVLDGGRHSSLQVLTHPEWWQDTFMEPRERVLRSVYGRAHATLRRYDAFVEEQGRENIGGRARALLVLRGLDRARYEALDFLWSRGAMSALFCELAFFAASLRIAPLSEKVAGLREQLLCRSDEPTNAQFEDACVGLCGMIADVTGMPGRGQASV